MNFIQFKNYVLSKKEKEVASGKIATSIGGSKIRAETNCGCGDN